MGTAVQKTALAPPTAVQIFYKRGDAIHVFTSPDMIGFHVADADLKAAYDLITEALSGLAEAEYGASVQYSLDRTFDEFKESVEVSETPGPTTINLLAPTLVAHIH